MRPPTRHSCRRPLRSLRRAAAWSFALAALAALAGLSCGDPRPAPPPPEAERAALGELLFFDPRLSGDRTVSCASCHDPACAFSDGRPASVGVSGRPLRRNAPALVNLAARAPYFWDGRAATLEEQAL
ncbi:MAG TPA: cytochrome-c peroxidase, partial [Polyangiaceae bacterium]|nr:cytochrome-c peroxidase [Polyangiaceae bacterium]